MLQVSLLGDLELELDEVPIDSPASRRARSLLGLLALDRRLHPRALLATRVWPDVLDESARTSLRSALAALRRSLGPEAERYLVATREQAGFSDKIETDAVDNEQYRLWVASRWGVQLEGAEGFRAVHRLLGSAVEYRRMDAFALDGLEERFGLVCCFGILHRVESHSAGDRVRQSACASRPPVTAESVDRRASTTRHARVAAR